ncbi:MAG TPA: helix-turn-helix transcriptional regulator [Methylotenera sp.]|nr:helix-turn-helix transcriptional regulator [Methylotenera sp.]
MSPFAPLIRLFREKRNLRSKDAAELLGCEPSFLSAVENGLKIPSQSSDFIGLLIKRYELDEDEIKKLKEVHKRSQRKYLLPLSATIEEYELFYILNTRLGNLLPNDIAMMRIILDSDKSNQQ